MTDFTGTTIEQVVLMRQAWVAAAEDAAKLIWEAETELAARMAADGAELREVAGYKMERKAGVEWDREALRPLLECSDVPEDALVGAYTAEHEETKVVPEAWNMTKVKPLTKYGAEAKRIIESAQSYGEPRFKIAKGERDA
jgi:hypothetical protein